jgi:hypothetical protein
MALGAGAPPVPGRVALARMTGTNAGSPTGRESHGDRGPVVVAGVTPRQGGRESRPQGERGQAVEDDRMPGGMRNAVAETVTGILRASGTRKPTANCT